MIVHIVGNRPQFIKLAPVASEIEKRGFRQAVVHTGQHYDENMSDIFFAEFKIPKPDKNLFIGSGTHAQMTGRAMMEIEKTLLEYSPKCVILYGDTDSTLAGALATVKLNIPIIHVEAGIRTGNLSNPEESNRIVTDHLSDMLFCPDQTSVNNLVQEGIGQKAFWTGDVMYDIFLQYRDHCEGTALDQYGLQKDQYLLMTWHRQENTSSRKRMEQIIQFLEKIRYKVVFPMHPRTRAKLTEFNLLERLEMIEGIQILQPIGYGEMMDLMIHSHMILTDSGGVSKESFFAGVRCIQISDLDLWPDLIKSQWITKVDLDRDSSIHEALHLISSKKELVKTAEMDFYGTGNAAVKITDLILKKYF